MDKKNLTYPVLFMSLITAILIFILALVNQVTLAKVQENMDLEFQRKILYVFDIYEDDMTDDQVKDSFESMVRIDENSDPNNPVYILDDGSGISAYALPFSGPGLWGSITGYLGIDSDLENIIGVEFISQSETPGLGGRISEEPYKSQYRGIPIESGPRALINRPAPGGNIDAIAGATQTSTFVLDMINADLEDFINSRGGGN